MEQRTYVRRLYLCPIVTYLYNHLILWVHLAIPICFRSPYIPVAHWIISQSFLDSDPVTVVVHSFTGVLHSAPLGETIGEV